VIDHKVNITALRPGQYVVRLNDGRKSAIVKFAVH